MNLDRAVTRFARIFCLSLATALTALPLALPAQDLPDRIDCLVPAQPQGGFDMTCQLLAETLPSAGLGITAVTRSYLPGGVGAAAYSAVSHGADARADQLIAFADGSIYNLALGQMPATSDQAPQWVAVLARDYGAVVVRGDASWQGLEALMREAAQDPHRIGFGGGGLLWGPDRMRLSLTARAYGIPSGNLRFLAFEGSGSCLEALSAGFVQACLNDAAAAQTAIDQGTDLRILAVYAPTRLPGALSDTPTAREQGVPLDWPVARGVYLAPGVDPAITAAWQARIGALMHTPAYAAALARLNLQPDPLTGDALRAAIAGIATTAQAHARALGLVCTPQPLWPQRQITCVRTDPT
ncbi:conserved hypothetical protein (plasmid) [Ketogulonicigenium vulgare Y25]|uniref:Tricarboxylate transport protein tctC n=1 Tax=Ketogulonicigenium vulgare (strain WSH-001) TaxID=759362 RepID=F9YBH6_KETVW|nr:tripartite tricarboxylate transporter substrate-binding protein [Ketogulonicigenium vulgare]ADO44290.1 conserved hypothetical protein [Ketogulonicigenium vulgare Y25]AEM42728.1 Tricarboxylate transport protein tctC [Ketogulonicigenium vulgare WSH-001]ALJ82823.1 tricarboxylate transporter [Ketogulonicigenium vulgare]